MNIRDLDVCFMQTINEAEAYLIRCGYSSSSNINLNSYSYYLISEEEWENLNMSLIYSNSSSGISINGNNDNNETAILVFYENNMFAVEDINNKTQEDNTLIGDVQNNVGLLISL